MPKKKRKAKKRKSYYIPVGKKGHVKRGCGKRKWKRGGNAYWGCKGGKKKHPYKKHSRKKR